MGAYADFADVYDLLMDAAPYDEWCAQIVRELSSNGIRDGIVLELGCGTGAMTERLAAEGYDMIGVDCAPEMLRAACEKRERSGHEILYLEQDMRAFELYGTVRAVVSVCDSLNYLLKDEDILACFRLVAVYLDPDGIFFFDLNTPYKYGTVIGERVIAENRDECSFIWENYYDAGTRINEYDLTVFVRSAEASTDGQEFFSRFQELHLQRGYALDEVEDLIRRSGLRLVRAYDADTQGEVTDVSERICLIAKKADSMEGRDE